MAISGSKGQKVDTDEDTEAYVSLPFTYNFCHSRMKGLERDVCLVTPGGALLLTWASYQIRKIAGCACAGNAGNVFPRRQFQRKPLVSDPGMHHGTCVTHVPWCMSGSLTCDDGENVPGIPGACAPAILRIWQEAHGLTLIPCSAPSHYLNQYNSVKCELKYKIFFRGNFDHLFRHQRVKRIMSFEPISAGLAMLHE